jgi:hypothetical protein
MLVMFRLHDDNNKEKPCFTKDKVARKVGKSVGELWSLRIKVFSRGQPRYRSPPVD